MELDMLPGSK